MNRYRAQLTFLSRSRCSRLMQATVRKTFDIEASNIRVAASRALEGFESRDDVSVSVQLTARNIVRPRVEKQSHGRARAAT